MKKTILLAIILTIVLVACTPEETDELNNTGNTVTSIFQEEQENLTDKYQITLEDTDTTEETSTTEEESPLPETTETTTETTEETSTTEKVIIDGQQVGKRKVKLWVGKQPIELYEGEGKTVYISKTPIDISLFRIDNNRIVRLMVQGNLTPPLLPGQSVVYSDILIEIHGIKKLLANETYIVNTTDFVSNIIKKRREYEPLSYSYFYNGPPLYRVRDQYFVKEGIVKISLAEPIVLNITTKAQYDTVYLDLLTKTAFGYCEGKNVQICYDKEKKFELNFSQHHIKIPEDWFSILNRPSTEESETIDNKRTFLLKEEKDDQIIRIWVDRRYFIPLRVTIEIYKDSGNGKKLNSTEKYDFEYMKFNNVRDSDLIHSQRQT